MAINPKAYTPKGLVAKILLEGRPPFTVVPFPRLNAAGEPICDVHIRLLSVAEEDLALAQARLDTANALHAENDRNLTDEELLTNQRACHILGVACRDPEDPSKPMFEHGARDVQQFNSEEVAQLMTTYAALKEKAWPALREMSDAEFKLWVDVISKGAVAYPFSSFSRIKLEVFCDLCVKHLVDNLEKSTTSTTYSGADLKKQLRTLRSLD